MKTMRMKYAGKCKKCKEALPVNSVAGYEVEEIEGSDKKKWVFYCPHCSDATKEPDTKIEPEIVIPKDVPVVSFDGIAVLLTKSLADREKRELPVIKSNEEMTAITRVKKEKVKTNIIEDTDIGYWLQNATWR